MGAYVKKIIFALISINGMQFVAGAIIYLFILGTSIDKVNNFLFITVGLMLLCNIVTIGGLLIALQSKNSNMEESIGNLENQNTTLRSQRHDYLNHFQVIYGLMELGEFQEAKNYLSPVFKDILKISKALKTSIPAVNALLQVKMQAAEEKEIDLFLEVKSDLSLISIEPWNLCKIIGNIIDNGLFILSDCENRKLEIEILEDEKEYFFYFRNNGPMIPEKIQSEIFKKGVSTKKEDGHGMGLYIVKNLAEQVGGRVSLQSSTEKTIFEVVIPKKKK